MKLYSMSDKRESPPCRELPFKLKIPDISKWLSELPLVNGRKSAELILSVLRTLKRIDMNREARFKLLELFYPYVLQLDAYFEKYLLDAAFPLTEEIDLIARIQIKLNRTLAEAYSLYCQDESFKFPKKLNQRNAAIALQRALLFWFQVLFQTSLTYKTSYANYWVHVFNLLRVAENLKVEDQVVDLEPCSPELSVPNTVRGLVKTIIIFFLAPGNKYRQRELVQIYRLVSRFADRAVFLTDPVSAEGEADFFIDLSKSGPPRHISAYQGQASPNVRFLRTRAMVDEIIQQRRELTKGNYGATSNNVLSTRVLRVFLRALSRRQTRKFQRIAVESDGPLFIGLAGLIDAISKPKPGAKDFKESTIFANPEKYREISKTLDLGMLSVADADLERAGKDNNRTIRSEYWVGNLLVDRDIHSHQDLDLWGNPVALHSRKIRRIEYTAKFLDSSAAGHCLLWTEKNNPILKVGEVLGILSENSGIEVGAIRWINAIDRQALKFGVELISPRVEVATMSLQNGPESSVRVLYLPEIETFGQPSSVVMRSDAFKSGDWISLNMNGEQKIYRLQNAIESTAGYCRIALHRADSDDV